MKKRPRSNNAERETVERLEGEGYEVLSRGWPDFIAIHPNGTIRFIEVKPRRHRRVKPTQQRVHSILSRFGIHVEVWRSSQTGFTTRATLREMYRDMPHEV
jgi:Holliday junction resolvase